MIEVDGKKVYKKDANLELVQGCYHKDMVKVVYAVESMGADVNATDPKGYARALMYALKSCSEWGDYGHTIIRYLIASGADVNFKHGDKYRNDESKPYFVYWVAENKFASDDLVAFVIDHCDVKTLNYKPTTKVVSGMFNKSALDIIKERRPSLYKKLVNKRIVSAAKK